MNLNTSHKINFLLYFSFSKFPYWLKFALLYEVPTLDSDLSCMVLGLLPTRKASSSSTQNRFCSLSTNTIPVEDAPHPSITLTTSQELSKYCCFQLWHPARENVYRVGERQGSPVLLVTQNKLQKNIRQCGRRRVKGISKVFCLETHSRPQGTKKHLRRNKVFSRETTSYHR